MGLVGKEKKGEEKRGLRAGLCLCAKRSGAKPGDRTDRGSRTVSATWSSQRREWHLLSLYVFGELGEHFRGPLYLPCNSGHWPQLSPGLPAGWCPEKR